MNLKKVFLLMISASSLMGSLHAGYPPGFTETWSTGTIEPSRWLLYRKQWGGANNGTVPELVSIEQDDVNGVTQNVLVLTAQGNNTTSSIVGVTKEQFGYAPSTSPQRVGACIATLNYYGSGTYSVQMKIGTPDNAPIGTAPVGLAPALWFFHYEEHYPEAGSDPTKLDPTVPQYQPRFREGSDNDGWYSTVNSEIDAPELGRNGNFTLGAYNTYVSEVDAGANYQTINYSNFNINILDGQYHTYKTKWQTNLVKTTLTDSQVVPSGAYYYAADSATSSIQGFPLLKQSDGFWYAYEGTSATFFVDGVQVGVSKTFVSPVTARLIIGAWFPSWAGVPNWAETKVYIGEVTISPGYQVGDVMYEPETYPVDGLVPPLVN